MTWKSTYVSRNSFGFHHPTSIFRLDEVSIEQQSVNLEEDEPLLTTSSANDSAIVIESQTGQTASSTVSASVENRRPQTEELEHPTEVHSVDAGRGG